MALVLSPGWLRAKEADEAGQHLRYALRLAAETLGGCGVAESEVGGDAELAGEFLRRS